jgi:hypothetical protein
MKTPKNTSSVIKKYKLGPKLAMRLALAFSAFVAADALANETLTVGSAIVSGNVTRTTPISLGYNMAAFKEGTNAADWFRYTEVDSARRFLSKGVFKPIPLGDAVTNQTNFLSSRANMRSSVLATPKTSALPETSIKWGEIKTSIFNEVNYEFSTLRARNVEILVNITSGKLPSTIDPTYWKARWSLWQHYYAMAYILSRDYSVRRYSMYNEPNQSSGPTAAEWNDLLILCSDAIQSGIADMNTREGKSLQVEIFAPNTAGGQSKYFDGGGWGNTAVTNLSKWIDGSIQPNWKNFHVFNYQQYLGNQNSAIPSGPTGFVTDYLKLRKLLDDNLPASSQGMDTSLTEFNVQTGRGFNYTSDTLDSAHNPASFGASLAGLANAGMERMYVFKLGQNYAPIDNSSSLDNELTFYPVGKNGMYFLQNDPTVEDLFYGGATRTAEAYRLFIKAAKGGRAIHQITASPGATAPGPDSGLNTGLWSMATKSTDGRMAHLFLANRKTSSIVFDAQSISVAGLGINNSKYFIEEVSVNRLGGVVQWGDITSGKIINLLTMPAQSVWLISFPTTGTGLVAVEATEDAQLREGGSTRADFQDMFARSDATTQRQVTVIKVPVPTRTGLSRRKFLLEMSVASNISNTLAQAHVYGLSYTGAVNSLTWAQASSTTTLGNNAFLRTATPNWPYGKMIGTKFVKGMIEHNVVQGHGTSAVILGQLAAHELNPKRMAVDVTDFVTSRPAGTIDVTFLIVQEHRWDVDITKAAPIPGKTYLAGDEAEIAAEREKMQVGDVQPAHLKIRSLESSTVSVRPTLVGYFSNF